MKFRLTVTAVREYEVDPKDYPYSSVKAILEANRVCISDDIRHHTGSPGYLLGHPSRGGEVVTLERDEWLYVHATTPERAREFFGVPPETVVRESGGETIRPDGELRCYAVRAPAAKQTIHKGVK